VQNQEAMVRGRRASAEGTVVNQEIVQQEHIHGTDSSVAEIIQSLWKNHFKSLDFNNFDTCLFSDNPLLESGKEMFKQLEEINWLTCSNCNETFICIAIGPRSGKCEQCSCNSALFSNENDLSPTPALECLSNLTPIETSCICPVVAIYKKGHFTASKGHTISVIQDVNRFATELPRLPPD
jgi:hypothetical protein